MLDITLSFHSGSLKAGWQTARNSSLCLTITRYSIPPCTSHLNLPCPMDTREQGKAVSQAASVLKAVSVSCQTLLSMEPLLQRNHSWFRFLNLLWPGSGVGSTNTSWLFLPSNSCSISEGLLSEKIPAYMDILADQYSYTRSAM